MLSKNLIFGLVMMVFCCASGNVVFADNGILNLVILKHGYTNQAQFDLDVAVVKTHLYTYPVYQRHWSQINFITYYNSESLNCFKNNGLIECDGAAVYRIVRTAGLPYDKILVLARGFSSSTASDTGIGGTVGVINAGTPCSTGAIVAHELGHMIGNLWEEYVTTSTPGVFDGRTFGSCYAGVPPNPLWPTLSIGSYSLGCHHPNWYRTSNCSVMRKTSCPTYNKVSEDLIEMGLQQYLTIH